MNRKVLITLVLVAILATLATPVSALGVCFGPLNVIGAAPLTVSFDATDCGGAFVDWNFGDFSTATGQTTSHTYGPGRFYVQAMVQNEDGSFILYHTWVTVKQPVQTPTVTPTLTPPPATSPTPVITIVIPNGASGSNERVSGHDNIVLYGDQNMVTIEQPVSQPVVVTPTPAPKINFFAVPTYAGLRSLEAFFSSLIQGWFGQ